MPKFTDSLRGFGLKNDPPGELWPEHLHCRYCGLDGTKSFENWLSLSWDHLLPPGDPKRDRPEFIVRACLFCNTADNHYFAQAKARGLQFENKTPDELVEQRRPYIDKVRSSYKQFWDAKVKPLQTQR